MATLFGILLVAVVAASVSSPLLRGTDPGAQPEAPRGDDTPEREKSVALLAIREAEFDHATGKLSEPDYALLRSQYEERALSAMKQIDARAGTVGTATAPGNPGTAAGTQSGTPESAGAAVTLARYCHACGFRFREADRFCTGCGTARDRGSMSSA